MKINSITLSFNEQINPEMDTTLHTWDPPAEVARELMDLKQKIEACTDPVEKAALIQQRDDLYNRIVPPHRRNN